MKHSTQPRDVTEPYHSSAIDVDSFRAIQVERDALRAERDELAADLSDCRARVVKLAAKLETTFLNINGALIALLLDTTFRNPTAIIQALLARYPNVPGLSQRTLEDKFAKATRSLRSALEALRLLSH
jgi:hypothetical protein